MPAPCSPSMSPSCCLETLSSTTLGWPDPAHLTAALLGAGWGPDVGLWHGEQHAVELVQSRCQCLALPTSEAVSGRADHAPHFTTWDRRCCFLCPLSTLYFMLGLLTPDIVLLFDLTKQRRSLSLQFKNSHLNQPRNVGQEQE